VSLTYKISHPGEAALPHNEFIAQLRGIAVLMVVVLHYTHGFPISYSAIEAIGNGYYGVMFFFTISGFLITGNLLKRYRTVASTNLREFYVMRAARILPCLALALVALSSISLLTRDIEGFVFLPGLDVAGAVAHVLTLTFNHYFAAGASGTMAWAVLWSICIEETFYIAFPLVAMLLRREALLITALCILVANGLIARHHGDLYSYFGCFDLMGMGALAAISARRLSGRVPRGILRPLQLMGAAIAFGTYAFLNIMTHTIAGPSLAGLGCAMMLFSSQLLQGKPAKPTFLGHIGSMSYEIYLFHMAIQSLLAHVLPLPTGPMAYVMAYVTFAVVMAATYFVSAGIANAFSKPLNRWIRDRFAKSRVLAVPARPCRQPNTDDVVAVDGALYERMHGAAAPLAPAIETPTQELAGGGWRRLGGFTEG
jgi:peptidoglycan/LPS O-acetylase OafA/YrhL